MRTDNPRIAAVVVTYNRLSMLKDCLQSIKNQTYSNFDIIVVNNGSTDGTEEYLAAQKDLVVINQENCGGAGGFFSGMKYMINNNYDALWMMDDDGLPDKVQLEKLIKYSLEYNIDYANALVLDRNDRKTILLSPKYLSKLDGCKDVMFGSVLPFNGTYVWRDVIEKVGLIKKEMFIWGDEREYTARVRSYDFKTATVKSAIHYHPPFKGEWRNILPFIKKGKVMLKTPPRDKIFYRNIGYIDKTYGQHDGLKFIMFFLFRLNFQKLRYFLKFYMMGRKDDFSVNLIG